MFEYPTMPGALLRPVCLLMAILVSCLLLGCGDKEQSEQKQKTPALQTPPEAAEKPAGADRAARVKTSAEHLGKAERKDLSRVTELGRVDRPEYDRTGRPVPVDAQGLRQADVARPRALRGPGGQQLAGEEPGIPLPEAGSGAPEVAEITTKFGKIVVEFFPDVAPKTVENFKKLARSGFSGRPQV